MSMQREETDQRTSRGPRQRRRRSYIIKPAFQWKYAISFALAACLIASIMSAGLYQVLHQQARLRAMSPETYNAEVGLVVLGSASAFAVLVAAALGLWFIVMTHRICGPLYVLEVYLAELAKGRLPRLRPLRRRDEFKEVHAAFAKAIDAWKGRRRAELAALNEAAGSARSALGGDDDDRKRALGSLASQIEDLSAMVLESLGEEPGQVFAAPVPSAARGKSGTCPDSPFPAVTPADDRQHSTGSPHLSAERHVAATDDADQLAASGADT